MGPMNQLRGVPLLSRTDSVRIQERRMFIRKPKQHNSLPNIMNQNVNGEKYDKDKNERDTKDGILKEDNEKRIKKNESDEKWNPLRPYLNEECKRRKEMVRSLNYKDFAPTNASTVKELHRYYNDSSFYHLHMLLMYHSNQTTSSYKRPQTRVGYVQKPKPKVNVYNNLLLKQSPPESPSFQNEPVNSRSSSSVLQDAQ